MVGRPWWDPKGPKGQMGQKQLVSFQKCLFLVYSTIAEIQDKFDRFVPLWWGDPAVVGPPYGNDCYGEASYGQAPYELQESLREATGRDFTRIGREFPLMCRRPKKAVFSDGWAVSGPFAL